MYFFNFPSFPDYFDLADYIDFFIFHSDFLCCCDYLITLTISVIKLK